EDRPSRGDPQGALRPQQQRGGRLRQPPAHRGAAEEGDPPDPQAAERQHHHRRQQAPPAARGDPLRAQPSGRGGQSAARPAAVGGEGTAMLNLAGTSYDFGNVLFAVLQECEHQRRALLPNEAAARLEEIARAKLAEIHASYTELGGTGAYWHQLEREVM